MTFVNRLQALLARYPIAAAAVYVAVVVAFMFTTLDRTRDVLQRRDAVASMADFLDQLDVRDPARARKVAGGAGAQAASPFLEGASASVAAATLMQRVTSTTSRMLGNTVSSQVDLKSQQAKAGFLTVTSSFEIEPPRLQALLYELESGMPFIFVDQLVVQAPSSSAANNKLKVLMAVSGQWRGDRK